MRFLRKIEKQLVLSVRPNKVVILYGARQVGKTTLIKKTIKQLDFKKLYINADEVKYRDILSSQDIDRLKKLIGDNELLIIDEGQRIENIGINLKLMVDEIPNIRIIVTGSSSLELANKISEPLTGRKITLQLFPVSIWELQSHFSDFDIESKLEEFLIYGTYPDTLNESSCKGKIKYLRELSSSYLYKDVLELKEIRKSPKIHKLLKLVAFQMGSQVSVSELANSLDLDKETVFRYLDLLEKSFVIFSLSGFSRNLRKEVTKSYKYYFYDLGIRNVLIDNFNSLVDRNDVGHLWENFIILERMKYLDYSEQFASKYFWRTYTGAEIDYVEERDGKLFGYEIKWGNKKIMVPKTWIEIYKNAEFRVINRENFLEFAGELKGKK